MTRAWVAGLLLAFTACESTAEDPVEHGSRIFVAVEGAGAVAALDGGTGELLGLVELAIDHHGMVMAYAPHNVQGSPDGATVWVTANASHDHEGGHGGAGGEGGEGGHTSHALAAMGMEMPDELVGIDAATLKITRRIPLGVGVHAAHVVMHGDMAYVTSHGGDAVLVVDLAAGQLARTITLPDGAGPHGARLTPDGSKLLVAGMGAEGTLLVLDTATGDLEAHPLPAPAVQTAVLPDGSAAFASILATAQVARLDLETDELTLYDLPDDAAGPVQLYPAPDGASLWIADQGLLVDGSIGRRAYQLDATTGALLRTVETGQGPHGVVVQADGARAWVTNAADGTVQSFDTLTGEILTTTQVGDMPNGITCVHADASMP